VNTLSLEKKNVLEGELEALYARYSKKQFLEDGVNKINLWKKSSLEIAERLREYELELKSLNEFVKEQTEMTSKIINKNFDKDINWKLYDIGYNGELSETCKLNYKGKPYQVLSTGEKAFVNLKCIETIQNFLDINMCIFIDNAEGITIPFNTNMQTIELYVKKGAKIQDIIKISDIYKKYNKGEK
jgi:hypothetical protein